MSKYEEWSIDDLTGRVSQLEHAHDVQRPSFWGAQWRESLDLALEIESRYNRLAEQNAKMLDFIQACRYVEEGGLPKLRDDAKALITEIEEGK